MGGNAFPGLSCPRISHEQYYILRNRCIAILKDKFYSQVISPPEAPSKTDHGDIDLLVSEPTHEFTSKDLTIALSAIKNTKVGVTTSFAVPLSSTSNSISDDQIKKEVEPKQYVQVDVHVCTSGNLEWELFLQSYGDLMQILGVMNRAVGLTANDKGLNLRLAEIEPYNRKISMLFLTKDPREAMDFLGLDHRVYFAEITGQPGGAQGRASSLEKKAFQTNEEIYHWCSHGRFYSPPSRHPENETSNDRTRYKKRAMFTDYIHDFLPSNPQIWSNRQQWTREEVLLEALRYFPSAKPAYDEAMVAHRQALWEHEVLNAVREVIPVTDGKQGEVMRGLKRFVRYDDIIGKPILETDPTNSEVADKPSWLSSIETSSQKEQLVSWVEENWPQIRALEHSRTSSAKMAKTWQKAEKVRQIHNLAKCTTARDVLRRDNDKEAMSFSHSRLA